MHGVCSPPPPRGQLVSYTCVRMHFPSLDASREIHRWFLERIPRYTHLPRAPIHALSLFLSLFRPFVDTTKWSVGKEEKKKRKTRASPRSKLGNAMRMDRETREITRDRKRNPRPNKHQLLRRCKRDREIGTVRVSLATQYARRFLRVRPPAAREFRRFESGEEKWRDPDVSRRDRLETRRTGIFALGEQRSAALSQTRFKSGSPKAHRFFPPRFAVPRNVVVRSFPLADSRGPSRPSSLVPPSTNSSSGKREE